MNDKRIIALFALLTSAYAALALFGPVDPASLAKYNLTVSRAHLLTLTIVAPLVAIWATALYGSLRFRHYAYIVKDTKEGLALQHIALGITLLAFSLPTGGLISSALTAIAIKHSAFLTAATIIKNYVSLVFSAASLLVVNRGADELIGTLKKNNVTTWPPFTMPIIITVCSAYTWLITTRASGPAGDTGYFMPNWLVLTTLAIPYLYIWLRGLLGAYKLFVYKRYIKGAIYKESLGYIAFGITSVVLLSVLTQIFTTLSSRISHLNLTPLLIIIYILVAFYAVGYGLIAHGSSKLKRIEEV